MNLSDAASDEERVGPEPAEHDDKDWTVVIANGCPECSFIGAGPSQLAGLIRESIEFWSDALRRPGATERLHPTVWSPLEYACHLTDLSHVFHERIDAIAADVYAPMPGSLRISSRPAGILPPYCSTRTCAARCRFRPLL